MSDKPTPPRAVGGFGDNPQNINRAGRPKKEWTMRGLIMTALEEAEKQTGVSYKELIAKRLIVEGVNGNMQAIKEINDRVDGKAMQSLDVTSLGQRIEKELSHERLADTIVSLFGNAHPGGVDNKNQLNAGGEQK